MTQRMAGRGLSDGFLWSGETIESHKPRSVVVAVTA